MTAGHQVTEESQALATVESAIAEAAAALGPRLRSGAVLGSLAHGGFSSLASDVDVALILDDYAAAAAPPIVEEVARRVREMDRPFADRLSVFWGTIDQLNGDAASGRFPPADRLDLIDSGHVLFGEDMRSAIRRPTHEELVVAAAEFVVTVLAVGGRREELLYPRGAVAKGPRAASKLVLFPVRFLYTAATGRLGRNDEAAAWYLAEGRPAADLVGAAIGWRRSWTDRDVEAAQRLVPGAALVYREFVADYLPRLDTMGRPDVAVALERVAAELAMTADR